MEFRGPGRREALRDVADVGDRHVDAGLPDEEPRHAACHRPCATSEGGAAGAHLADCASAYASVNFSKGSSVTRRMTSFL